ncbi:MAG: hypothetical protein ACK5B9_05380 [Flavobacteriia bacterium]|jgi:hypothetical protein
MAKNVIDLDEVKLAKLKQFAIKNSLPKNSQNLVSLAFDLAINSIELLDEEDFFSLNNLSN